MAKIQELMIRLLIRAYQYGCPHFPKDQRKAWRGRRLFVVCDACGQESVGIDLTPHLASRLPEE